MSAPTATRTPGPAAEPRLPPLAQFGLVAGPMLSMIDSAVVNVAVPDIAREMHSTLQVVQWAVSGYLLSLAAGLAAAAWVARRFGTLRAYRTVLAAFTLASAACALAPDTAALIAARALQGLVGAPMVPLAMGLLLGRGGAARQMPASVGIVFFAAPALGPALGGLLISAFGWRSIFVINLPVGLAALAGALTVRTARHRDGDRQAYLDLPGLVLLGTGLALATYGADQGAQHGWLTTAAVPWWLGGLVLLAAYTAWAHHLSARTNRVPAVDLDLLRHPQRALALGLCAAAGVVLFAVLFLAPVYLQSIQRHGTTLTGLVLLPQGVVMGLASVLGNKLTERGAIRRGVAAGMALLAAGTAALLLLTENTPVWATALLLCARGIALGLTIQPLTLCLLGDLDEHRLPDANTLFNVTERLAGSFGIALLAGFFTAREHAGRSPVTALHDCVLVLALLAATAALGPLTLRELP